MVSAAREFPALNPARSTSVDIRSFVCGVTSISIPALAVSSVRFNSSASSMPRNSSSGANWVSKRRVQNLRLVSGLSRTPRPAVTVFSFRFARASISNPDRAVVLRAAPEMYGWNAPRGRLTLTSVPWFTARSSANFLKYTKSPVLPTRNCTRLTRTLASSSETNVRVKSSCGSSAVLKTFESMPTSVMSVRPFNPTGPIR